MAGTGTVASIKKQAEKLKLNLTAPEVPQVDPEEVPITPHIKGEGILPSLTTEERFGKAVEVISPTYNGITGLLDEYGPEVDHSFDIAEHPELFQGVTEDNYDYIIDSVSLDDAKHRLAKISQENQNMQDVMRGGNFSGFALMAGVAVGDPLSVGTMLLEGAGVFGVAQKLSKANRVARMAAIAGTTAGVETAVLAASQATTDAEDVLYATVAGTALGTAFGKLSNRVLDSDDFTRAGDAVQSQFSAKVTKQMDENLVTGVHGKPVQRVRGGDEDGGLFGPRDPELALKQQAQRTAEEVVEGADELTPAGYVDAFEKTLAERLKNGSFNPAGITNSRTFKLLAKNPLMSSFTKLFKTKNKGVQFFASELLENASGTGVRSKTAAVLKHVWERGFLEDTMPDFRRSYNAFTKEKGVRWVSKEYWTSARDEFNLMVRQELEQVRNASVKGVQYESTAPKYVQDFTKKWRKNMKLAAERAKKEGVKGFDDLVVYDGYVPLSYKGKMLAGMEDKLLMRYQRLLATGYEKAEIDPKSAATIAKAVLNRKISSARGLDTNPGALLSKDSRVFLRELLDLNGVGPKEQEALFARIDGTMQQRGTPGFAKSRVPIDLTVSDGDIQLLDIVNNDIAGLGTRYFTEISGRSALARKGITNDGAYRALKSHLMAQMGTEGEKLGTELDGLYAQFLGQPVGEGVHRGARRMQEWAMTSMLGMVGVAQMAESANVIAAHGVTNFFKYSSELRKFRKGLTSGNPDKGLLGELQAHMGGLWDEHLFFRPEVRLDQAGGISDGGFNALDNVLAGSREVLGYVSGMNTIKNLQQQFTAIGQVDKVVKMLKSGKKTDQLLNRFRDVGWDESTLASIKSKVDDGTITFQKNGSVDRLNLEKWDAKTYEDFTVGMHRHSAQIIQFPLVGETSLWQHSTLGSSLTQFRSFAMLAIEKQSARQLSFADSETYTAFTASLGLSSMLYMAKVHATSVGRPDREEYLQGRLSTGALINGAIQWSAVFGLTSEAINAFASTGLLPQDWGSGSIGRGGAASYSIDKNMPAASVGISAIKTMTGLMQAISPMNEHEYGKQDVNNLFATMPLGNTAPAIASKNLFQSILHEDE